MPQPSLSPPPLPAATDTASCHRRRCRRRHTTATAVAALPTPPRCRRRRQAAAATAAPPRCRCRPAAIKLPPTLPVATDAASCNCRIAAAAAALLPPPPLSYPTVARTSRPSKRRETPITATALPSCRRWCCNAAAPKRQGTPATALSPRRCQPQSTLKTPLPVPCTWRPKGGRRGGAALVE